MGTPHIKVETSLLASRIRRMALAGISLLGIAVAGLWFMDGRQPASAAIAARPTGIIELTATEVASVERRELRITLPLTGTLQPLQQALVKAKVAGEIKQVQVREGQTVKQGQMLAQIDSADLEAKLQERAGNLEGKRAELALAGKNREKDLALLKQGFISQNAFDKSQSAYLVNEAAIKSQQALVTQARIALQDAVVRAPMDAVVAERFVQTGDKASVDAKLFSLVSLAQMELAAAVPASEISNVRIGQEVTLRLEGLSEHEFHGHIDRINPTTQAGSRSILVYAVIPNPDGLLRGGMFAKGALVVNRVAAANTVPIATIREEDGQPFVYRVEHNVLTKQAVTLGVRNEAEGLIQVLTGLEAGTTVVKTDLGATRHGAQVRIGPAS